MTKRSFENKQTVLSSEFCGCYYCLQIYPSIKVKEYIIDANGETASCHICRIDSVVPYNRGLDTNMEYFSMELKKQHDKSFGIIQEN